jgi:UDP-N-acetylglucosamine 1-carboxyvinyltransferase
MLRAAGAEIEMGDDCVSIDMKGRLQPVDLVAEPFPGIPTDIQAQWTALMSVADGTSRVCDRVFPQRFQHVAELNRLGARIACVGDTAVIDGVPRLSGARVSASDLRASAALVLAGLVADRQTIVGHIHHLDRGYDRLDAKLRSLGAQIERVDCPPSDRETVQGGQSLVPAPKGRGEISAMRR